MKTIINLSGTSPRIDFTINEFHEPTAGGLQQVETRSPEEESVKMDLVYQITRALLRNISRRVYTESHDLVAVKEWFVEIFGDLWDADGFASEHYPDPLMLGRSKERVRAMGNRLMYIQTYQKLLNDSIALTDRGPATTQEFYPGLLTIAYQGPSPDGDDLWVKHSLRIIKEIPREVLISLHDLFNDPKIPHEQIGMAPERVTRTLLAHRVPDAMVATAANHAQEHDETTAVPVEGAKPTHYAQYAQNFDEMDFAELTARDKALVAAALRRAALIKSNEDISRLFRPRIARAGFGRPLEARTRPAYASAPRAQYSEQRP